MVLSVGWEVIGGKWRWVIEIQYRTSTIRSAGQSVPNNTAVIRWIFRDCCFFRGWNACFETGGDGKPGFLDKIREKPTHHRVLSCTNPCLPNPEQCASTHENPFGRRPRTEKNGAG
jgi:hypothetical protein